MTKTCLRCSRITFNISNTNDFTIRFIYNGFQQGILTIDNHEHKLYNLYIWFDEGNFPKFFDVTYDDHKYKRLKIIGVDDV